ncbi:glycosyltransferase family 4 protein [Leifsonia sp. NPDC080035]|uniref:Glycosyltransferase family 4 protein n=1 Tax=Leifsonia sp. NPDC080035 TaxID=3143936 RepID=A0AAU7GGI5_9MICO
MSAPLVFAVPRAVDDPERVSGGNVYDRRVRDALRAAGREVRMLLVADEPGALAVALRGLADGALLLADGLLVSREPGAVVAEAHRLRIVILAHMVEPDPDEPRLAAFRAALLIVATSEWTRTELAAQGAADAARVVVAHPGADPAPVTAASEDGGRLLCVAVVAPHKGQDLLVRALAGFADRPGWTCTVAGSLRADPGFAEALGSVVDAAGLADRIGFPGVLDGRALEDAYAHADLLVQPSRSESYGMAIAEALAHGVPVLATAVGGIGEAIPVRDAAMLVPPDDPWALHVVLQQWWADPARRAAAKAAALAARSIGRSWAGTAAVIEAALAEAERAPAPLRTGAAS